MRTLRLFVLLALAGALPACSALFDGSRFTGGTGSEDAGTDAGTEDGGGTDGGTDEDAGTDGGVDPCAGVTCDVGEYCDAGECADCDDDGDGFVVDRPGCVSPEPFDCDDANAEIRPGALPICDNGIDESCGVTAPIGLPTDEIGFFPVHEVTPPPAAAGGMDLKHIRVAALSVDRAAVFFQTRPARAMIWYGNVALADASGAPPPLTPYSDMQVLPPPTNAVRLSFDVARDPMDRVHLVAMIEDFEARALPPNSWILTRDTQLDRDGGWVAGGGSSYRPDDVGYPAFNVIGQPAVIQNPAGLVLGVPASYTSAGTTVSSLVALGVSGGLVDVIGGSYPPLTSSSGPEWAASDGRNAVFPGASGSYIAWDGSVDSSGPTEHLQLVPPGARLGRAVVLSSHVGAARVLRVVEPRPTEIVVHRTLCPDTSTLSACTFDASPIRIPIALGAMDPLITSFSGDEMGFHFAYVARDGGMEEVRYAGFTYSDSRLTTAPLPTVGDGPIVDLDIGGTFEADMGRPGAGRALLTFAYARRNRDGDPAVYVGGVTACVGYGSD